MKKILLSLFFYLAGTLTASGLWAGTISENRFLYPEYSKTISMDFKDASLNDVLKIFSQQSGLNFIAAQEVIDKKITLFLDKVPVEEALERILDSNNLAYEIQPESNIFVVKSVSRSGKDLLTRVYYLKYAAVSSSKLNKTFTIEAEGSTTTSQGSTASTTATGGMASAVKAVLTSSGKLVEDPRSNSLIITDIPAQFPAIEETIARLDVPVPQILIEVEMLDISKEAGEQLGIKYGATPLVFSGAQREHYYPWDTNRVIHNPNVTAGEPAYTVGNIDASGLSATLQFLKSRTDTKNLARPRILTLNNETAEIKISADEAIGIKSETTGGGGSSTTQVFEAERVQTGIFLTVTPQANLLSREITMAIVPKVIQARTGGTYQGQTFKDPEERGTKSILRVHDGDTIILGGLLRIDYSNTYTQLPILGDLPIVGAAFRHKDRQEKERELVIFMTPHIVPDTVTTGLVLTGPEKLVREQPTPPARLSAIEKTLTSIEGRKQ